MNSSTLADGFANDHPANENCSMAGGGSVGAYLITLQRLDSAPIVAIQRRLQSHGFEVHLVRGIKGADLAAGDYFARSSFWLAKTGRPLTPGELGCALSHERALRLAASSGTGRHLILEDDFIASDAALTWIRHSAPNIPKGTLMHFGAQEGLERFYRYVRAKPVPALAGTMEVFTADLEYLRRTTAYLLDATTASAFADLIAQGAFMVDDFLHALENNAIERLWFRWLVSHPRNHAGSHIEAERLLLRSSVKRHWSHRSQMIWARLWRLLITRPTHFLKNTQDQNQMTP